eukprot:475806_1
MATLAFVSRLKSSGHIRPSLLLLSGSDAPPGGVSDGDSQFSEKVVAGGLVDPDSGIMLKNDGIVANDFEDIVKYNTVYFETPSLASGRCSHIYNILSTKALLLVE